ncbi:MAG TPA: hypothetical protein VIV54_18170 [Burkholderiales bacterium]
MPRRATTTTSPTGSPRTLTKTEKVFRVLAIAVAAHGIVFALCSVTLARVETPGFEFLGWIYLFVVVAPAMILTVPFSSLLWYLHLMETPGWFAWPRPAGFALVYATWVLALTAISLAVRRR